MGLVYLPIHFLDFYRKLVAKYTNPMDPIGPGTNLFEAAMAIYPSLRIFPLHLGTTILRAKEVHFSSAAERLRHHMGRHNERSGCMP